MLDAKIYTKQSVAQPDIPGKEVIKNGIFDFIPIIEDGMLKDIELITTENEILEQYSVVAALKQKGSDPLALSEGVSWAQASLGEVSQGLVVDQIKQEVGKVSPIVNVTFTTITLADGSEQLSFTIGRYE